MVAGFKYDLRMRLWEVFVVSRPQTVLFRFIKDALCPFYAERGCLTPSFPLEKLMLPIIFSAGGSVLRGESASPGSLGCDASLLSLGFLRGWSFLKYFRAFVSGRVSHIHLMDCMKIPNSCECA